MRPVVVGDRPLDDDLRALVAAAREAMVNAAKHAEVDEISVYVEVEEDGVHVFVRDRGVGFDPDAVPDGPARARGFDHAPGSTATAARSGCAARAGEGTEVRPVDAARHRPQEVTS